MSNDLKRQKRGAEGNSVTWTNFGTILSRFTNVSRCNAKKVDLTLVQAWVLQVIFLHETVSPSELSAYSGTTLPTITGIIDGLSKLSYVKRERSVMDRRKVVIQLTEKGKNILRRYQDLQQSFTEKIENGLGKNGMDLFLDVVQALVNVLESL